MAINLPNVWTNNKGQVFFRYKLKGEFQLARLPDPTDPGFAAAYEKQRKRRAAERARPAPEQAPAKSFIALIREYRGSADMKEMKPVSRVNTERYLAMFEERFGMRLVKDLSAEQVDLFIDEMKDTPGKANAYISKLRTLINFGIRRGYTKFNPAVGAKRLKIGEHKPWPEKVLLEALERGDAMDRLSIITGLCSGQRIADCIAMSREKHFDFAENLVEIVQEKTGKMVFIPIHPMWKKALDDTPAGTSTILYKRGSARKPFNSPDGIQKRLRELMIELGYVERDDQGRPIDKDGHVVVEGETHPAVLYTFHGLRKNATNYLAELGLSPHEISTITGMSLEMVKHYTRDIQNKRIARRIAERVISGDPFQGESLAA